MTQHNSVVLRIRALFFAFTAFLADRLANALPASSSACASGATTGPANHGSIRPDDRSFAAPSQLLLRTRGQGARRNIRPRTSVRPSFNPYLFAQPAVPAPGISVRGATLSTGPCTEWLVARLAKLLLRPLRLLLQRLLRRRAAVLAPWATAPPAIVAVVTVSRGPLTAMPLTVRHLIGTLVQTRPVPQPTMCAATTFC